jgi:inorganic pyrophosphatase
MWRHPVELTVAAVLVLGAVLQIAGQPPEVLPAAASTQLARSLDDSRGQRTNIWRDTPPTNADGTVNGYIEIARGDRRKWEFNVRHNARAIDRVMSRAVGGYPVNYGFVPQTVSYDGDPFDILVLGPPIAGGSVVRGAIVGLMHMTDEKGLDSKVVVSPVARDGGAAYALTPQEQERIGDYFKRYKLDEPGKFSEVPGWGSPAQGRAYVDMTHAFFRGCRGRPGTDCALPRRQGFQMTNRIGRRRIAGTGSPAPAPTDRLGHL